MRNRQKQKRCCYCGRYFRPDYRVGEQQKACKAERCRRRRKREAQKKWVDANPGCFTGRYDNTRSWREAHPQYQRQWRAKRGREIQDAIAAVTPVKTMHLMLPEEWFKAEIQDKRPVLIRLNSTTYILTDSPREIQDAMEKNGRIKYTLNVNDKEAGHEHGNATGRVAERGAVVVGSAAIPPAATGSTSGERTP